MFSNMLMSKKKKKDPPHSIAKDAAKYLLSFSEKRQPRGRTLHIILLLFSVSFSQEESTRMKGVECHVLSQCFMSTLRIMPDPI